MLSQPSEFLENQTNIQLHRFKTRIISRKFGIVEMKSSTFRIPGGFNWARQVQNENTEIENPDPQSRPSPAPPEGNWLPLRSSSILCLPPGSDDGSRGAPALDFLLQDSELGQFEVHSGGEEHERVQSKQTTSRLPTSSIYYIYILLVYHI